MANNTATVALGEADQKARPGEEQKQAEDDFEPALRQRMREARAERCDPARDRRDRNDAGQGDEPIDSGGNNAWCGKPAAM
jgi:hypothetical protein